MIVSLYAALLALIFIALTIRVIKVRRLQKISIGDGGNIELQRAIASQSNFCQSAPIFLILFIISEIGETNTAILNICGTLFILGRIFHAYGINCKKENFYFRISGMIVTLSTIATLSVINLTLFLAL